MKRLSIVFALILNSFSIFGQEPSLIFTRFIKDSPDTVWCDLQIWKRLENGEYDQKTKRFYNQTIIYLDNGEYVFQYWVDGSPIFKDHLNLNEGAKTIIINVLLKPESIGIFDFSKAIYVDPILYDFISRRYSYVEF